jgi:hypothetical protein
MLESQSSTATPHGRARGRLSRPAVGVQRAGLTSRAFAVSDGCKNTVGRVIGPMMLQVLPSVPSGLTIAGTSGLRALRAEQAPHRQAIARLGLRGLMLIPSYCGPTMR